ncbi:unnamed protein product [Pipistrellus nathusii]|uniref:Uncharacterized protein n=1 Tax=Pipistrellus nathusii TaxID=59473 RepID=A0ABN9ZV80_PIPNA
MQIDPHILMSQDGCPTMAAPMSSQDGQQGKAVGGNQYCRGGSGGRGERETSLQRRAVGGDWVGRGAVNQAGRGTVRGNQAGKQLGASLLILERERGRRGRERERENEREVSCLPHVP